jgi:3',5'-cyclic AMP phosphodiesterase CpdA
MFSFLILSHVLVSTATEFLSIGDWGDSGAHKIAGYMGDYNPEWILAIGDNFYDSGVSGVDDKQFKDKFEDTFTAKSLQCPWYVVAGNHDYYGGDKGIQGEISYSTKSDRWNFPKFYYDKVVTTADATVHILGIDTWRINGGDTYVNFDPFTNRYSLKNKTNIEYRYRIGADDMGKPKRDILIRSFEQDDPLDPVVPKADQPQLDWIKSTLSESTADWKIILGHFPVSSATTGEHGDTKSLIKLLLPIMKEAGADLYFSGHDHILQHIQRDGINFFGSGAGAREHKGVNTKYTGLKGYTQGSYGFMVHEVTKKALSTTFVNQNGEKTYNYTITK